MKTICAVIAVLVLSGCQWNYHRAQAEAEPAAASIDWLELIRHTGAVVPVLVLFWTMWKWNKRHEEREDEARRRLEEIEQERARQSHEQARRFIIAREALAMGYIPPRPPPEPLQPIDDVGRIIRGEGPCGPTSRPVPSWVYTGSDPDAEKVESMWTCGHCGGKWSADRAACPACGAPRK